MEHVRETLGREKVSEQRACRMLGQSRSTQRRTSRVPDDEPQLIKEIIKSDTKSYNWCHTWGHVMTKDDETVNRDLGDVYLKHQRRKYRPAISRYWLMNTEHFYLLITIAIYDYCSECHVERNSQFFHFYINLSQNLSRKT